MTRPDDIPEDAWDVANAVMQLYFHGTNARNQDQWDAYVLIAASAILADRAQRSALAQPSAPEGWQDISTAPRDGRDLHLYGRGVHEGGMYAKGQHIGFWSEQDNCWFTKDPAVVCLATHWRPLPPAPTAEEV